MRWVVVKTHPRREHFAAQYIARQGYGVFLPRVLEHVGHGSHRYALAKPLFPSYLFAAFEAFGRFEVPLPPRKAQPTVATALRIDGATVTAKSPAPRSRCRGPSCSRGTACRAAQKSSIAGRTN